MTTLRHEPTTRPPARNLPERRALAVDREPGLHAWAVVKLPARARGAIPGRPRYLQHGRLVPPEDVPSVPPARAREVVADLLAAYSPATLVLTARPPLREARADDPYAFLAAAHARGVPVAVVDQSALHELLPPVARDLEEYHALRARPTPEGAARALASTTPAWPHPVFCPIPVRPGRSDRLWAGSRARTRPPPSRL